MADEDGGRATNDRGTDQLRRMKTKGKSKTPRRKPENLLKIGNKEKGYAFVDKRKKIALKEYKKLLKKTREEHRVKAASDNLDKPALTNPGRNSETNNSNQWQSSESYTQGIRKRNYLTKEKPVNRFSAAEREFKQRKFEKERQIKERETIIQKHREEVQEKMKKRRETFGRLSQRTRKGQPIMANQIEHLLGKIQSQS